MAYLRVLYRKAIADLHRSRIQSLAIIVMVAAATTAVTLALTLAWHADDPWQRVFAAANSPHAVFYSAGAEVDLGAIGAMEGVRETAGPFPVISGRDLVRDGDRERLSLLGFPVERPTVARPVLAGGRWLDPAGTGEIVLDRALARDLELRVGDQVDVETGGSTARFTVVGLSITAWRGPFPNWKPAIAYVLPETIAQLAPNDAQSVFFVRLGDPAAADQFVERAVAAFPEGTICCTLSWEEVQRSMNSVSNSVILVLSVLSVFALIAVTLVVANTIGGRMLTRRREIGLLKAAGMTPWQVTLLFLVEHLILGLIGAIVGVIAGTIAGRPFLWRVAASYDTAPIADSDLWLRVAIVLGILGMVALATIIPAWHAGRIGTADALSPRRRRVHRASWLGRLAIRLRLPAAVIVGLKDVFARPVRAWLAVAALTLTVTAACFGLGMEATLDTYFDGSIWAANPHEIAVDPAAVAEEETRRILDGMPEVTGYVANYQFQTKRAGEARWLEVSAVDGDVADVGLRIREGRLFSTPGEAIVGQGLLDATGLDIGDDLDLVVDGQPLRLRIVGRFVAFDNDGELAMVPFDTIRSVLPHASPDEYFVQLAPGTDKETFKVDLISASGGRFGVAVDTPAPERREVFELRAAVYGLTAVLLAVGLINLITVALLGVRERVRDLGILKALGMTPRQLAVSEITGMALLALLAWAAGVPLGMVVGPAVYDVLAKGDGLGTGLATVPSWLWLLALIPLTIFVAALGAVIPARIAARLPVTGAVRAE